MSEYGSAPRMRVKIAHSFSSGEGTVATVSPFSAVPQLKLLRRKKEIRLDILSIASYAYVLVLQVPRSWVLEELKQTVETKDAELRQKQREIDRLYGKLAVGSSLSELELSQKLQEVLARFAVEHL